MNARKTSYTKAEDRFIRKNYLTMPVKRMADVMGRSYTGIIGRMSAMELVLPPEIIEARKKASQFAKGNISHNKGKPMLPHVYDKVKQSFFKKGHKPKNTIEAIGTITFRTRKNTKNADYYWIKLETGMKQLHVYNWEAVNGPVPKGYLVRFIDGNHKNCDITNLELITRAEHVAKNSIQRYPNELRQIMKLNAKLKRILKQKTNP